MISCMLVNTSTLPYKISNDIIRLKVKIFLDGELLTQSNVRIDIYGNVDTNGVEKYLGSILTSELGIAVFEYSTNNITYKDMNTAIFNAKIQTQDTVILSNNVRCNFIEAEEFNVNVIDAGTCYDVSKIGFRSSYPIYDAFTNRESAYVIVRQGI